MPELPEVEAVCRKVRRDASGARIESVLVLRDRVVHPQSQVDLERAIGQSVRAVERFGKNIVLRLSSGDALRVHLRMTGDLHVIPDARLRTSTARVLFGLQGGRGLVFDDPRVLGTVHLHNADSLRKALAGVGIDPLTNEFTPALLCEAARRSAKPAKIFLMDQKPIAGLGNIYAAEALFRARIHPERAMNSLRRPKLHALHAAIREVLEEAVKHCVTAYRKPGYFEEKQFAVYGRKGDPCLVCGREVARIAQGGRSTYFCPKCQRP